MSPCQRYPVVRRPTSPSGPPGLLCAVEPADLHACRGTPHPPNRPPAVSPAGSQRPTFATQSPPSGTAIVKVAPSLGTVLDSPPLRRQLTPSIRSTSTMMAIAREPDEDRSPNDATVPQTVVPLESIAPKPPPQPTQSSIDAATRSTCAPNGKSSLVPLLSLPIPSPSAVFPPLPTPRSAFLAYRHSPTRPSEFRFEWSADAAAHNWRLLRRYDLNLGSMLRAPRPAIQHIDVWVRVPSRSPPGAPFILASALGVVRRTNH